MNNNSIGLDKSDYLIATSCGLISGLIDAIFVGDFQNSILGKAVDGLADKFVIKAAQFFWMNDKRTVGKNKKMPTELHTCISYLEQAFPVRYDARYAKDLNVEDGVLEHMSSSNHHLLSLAHSPDPIGLVFSIIDQYNVKGSASFWDKGKVIHVVPNKTSKNAHPYFYGTDNPSKLYCGFVNWIGHLISDISGSSSTREPNKAGRGMGISMPFYSLVEACNWGDFNGDTFAEIMTKVYEEGYDFRFGIATAIPVVINELLVRAVWTIKNKFIEGKDLRSSLPSMKNGDFRLFLLMATTTFEVVDCTFALGHAVKFESGLNFNWVGFFSNVNLIGITRLSGLILKEVIIRVGSIASTDSEYLTSTVLELLPEESEKKLMALSVTIKEYIDCLDYKKKIEISLEEYKEAKENRIRVEKQVEESINNLLRYRAAMQQQFEIEFAEYLVVFDESFNQMNEAILNNDSDAYIDANSKIQNQLGKDMQFHSQDEFDGLMGSDDDFKL